MRQVYSELEELIKKALSKLYPDRSFSFFLEVPRNKKFGDVSLTLPLKLSSELNFNSLDIARDIKGKIEELLVNNNPGLEKVEVVSPGFVNFFFREELIKELFLQLLNNAENFFKNQTLKGRRVLIEFVSANPTGPLSIAHGRQAVVGDVLAKVYSFLGAEVLREYYINDEGTQIDLFVESVVERMKELKGQPFRISSGGYQGEYVKDIAKKILDEGLAEEVDVRGLSLGLILERIREDLSILGVEFDNWVSQQDLNKKGAIQEIIDYLKEKGLTYQEDGALWFKSTLFGDDKDRVLIRKDGTFTYFAADIAYHRHKLERAFNSLLNLWGPDHHGYIKRLEASLKAIAKEPYDFKVIIIQLVTVKGKEKMSKRLGNILFLRNLVSSVGRDAARFFYLVRKNSSHLEFDLDIALSKNFDNPLYYIQYAHARICSIINKYSGEIDYRKIHLLKEEEEISLLKRVLEFENTLKLVCQENEPYYLVDYAKSLAHQFHLFYEHKRVLIEEDSSLAQARLSLISGVKIVLGLVLSLLGLSAPSKM